MQDMKLTGYPSIDKPWLKYYSEEAINAKLPECTIYEYLYENNKTHLNDTALIYYGKKTTFHELFNQIDATCKALVALGVKARQIVTICSVTTPEVIYTVYALNKLGAIPNMIDPRTSVDGIKKYLDEVDSQLCFVIDACFEKFCSLIEERADLRLVMISAADSLPVVSKKLYRIENKQRTHTENEALYNWSEFIKMGYHAELSIESISDSTEETALIVHTGGTTGTPKGVEMTNKNINSLSHQFHYGVRDFSRGYRFLDIIPPFVAYGMCGGIHTPLTCGMTVIIVPKFDPTQFDNLLLRYRPTHFMGVPTYFQQLFISRKLINKDLSYIVFPAVGGDNMNQQLEVKANEFLVNHKENHHVVKGYGLTEVCSAACGSVNNSCNELGSVGIPFIGNTISIFEPGTQRELTYNQSGEICISGPTVMKGYYGNSQETAQIRQRHNDGKIWIHSGDIGYMTEDGIVHVIDRIKRVIISSGWNLYPSVIEEAILHHKDVSACAVIAANDPIHIHVPKAFVVLKNTDSTNTEKVENEIKQICSKYLPEHSLPASYAFRDSLPLTSIGKVDYRALERDLGAR